MLITNSRNIELMAYRWSILVAPPPLIYIISYMFKFLQKNMKSKKLNFELGSLYL